MILISVIISVLAVFLLGLVLKKVIKLEPKNKDDQSMLMLQDRINQLEKQITNQLNSITMQVNERLKESTGIFGNVQNSLGILQTSIKKFDETYKQLDEDITKFQAILKPPAFRGGLGELLLENLLKNIFPDTEHYKFQYRFKSGKEVDAVIIVGDRLVAIDSKFPMDNFEKMINSKNDDEKNKIRKDFVRDIKNHIDSIASKYILPDEKTFDFALMYIAAENVYYEIMVKPDAEGASLLSYANSKKVIPVSPNSIYAYLQTILMGLKGLQINKRAQEIVSNIMRLEGDLNKFKEDFRVLGNHLKNTKDRYDDAERKLEKFSDKLATSHKTEALEDLSQNKQEKNEPN